MCLWLAREGLDERFALRLMEVTNEVAVLLAYSCSLCIFIDY